LAGSAQPVSKTNSPAGVCCSTPSGSPLLLQRQAKSPVSPTGTLATVLTFEGLGNQEGLANFYNGGTGGNGSGPGPNFGITFSSNALAIIDADAGGTGNFGGEPSPSTIMFFLTGAAATMNVPAGFTDGFSFYYSAINSPGVVTVYDGPNATGTVLATLALPLTPNNGAPDPTGQFSPLLPLGVSFSGTARSVDFGGAQNQIGFDDITLGSATPGVASNIPTLSFWAMGLLALALAAGGFLVTKRIV
jgi:hypothetical protein